MYHLSVAHRAVCGYNIDDKRKLIAIPSLQNKIKSPKMLRFVVRYLGLITETK